MLIEAWRRDYNESRPHMAPDNIPPREYALQAGVSSSPTGFTEVESYHSSWTIDPMRFKGAMN